jgi:hypothetical protein
LCAALLLVLSVPVRAASAHGTLAVSMQVLPACASLVEQQTATVHCPPGFAYLVTRSRSTRTGTDATQTLTQTVTIRY